MAGPHELPATAHDLAALRSVASGLLMGEPTEDLDQLGTRYTHQNRAWQYAGSFAVAGAGTVDGDTSDLLLAPAPGGTNL